MKQYLLVILVFYAFSMFEAHAQVSIGGMPKQVVELKSSRVDRVSMPTVQNFELRLKSLSDIQNAARPKPLRFAHPFDVSLSPDNSGTWSRTIDGEACWRLRVYSEGALSINLIFDEFQLPEEARLFVYNSEGSQVLGAFTSINNKKSKKLAISPVKGEELVIHYEVPEKSSHVIPFVLKRVNHDFLGILEKDKRRPNGKAGSCNIDINCDLGKDWNLVKNAVCRMIVDGVEICTGTLINNTAEDQRPYVLSAEHCYARWRHAETSVYTFNYESPYCAPLDGDPSNSVSGAIMKAGFDSLDFALVELSLIPPPEYRPHFAGWDRVSRMSDSTISIHHPQGDVKKIALDADPPVLSDYDTDPSYISNAFLKILRWDEGVTEAGSSGGALFSTKQHLIGTLTGGVALCGNPVEDYFSRFEMAWDYRNDSTKQLKHWLDPIESGETKLDGKEFYEGEDLCGAFTNLNDYDEHSLVKLEVEGQASGYWGGTNSAGVSEFMERFSLPGNETLTGVSMGVGKLDLVQDEYNSEIKLKVYTGGEMPDDVLYEQVVALDNLAIDAMNYIPFDYTVQPTDTFFIGFELSKVHSADEFAIYQSLRSANTDNYFYFKQNGSWYDFEEANLGYNSMVNVFEVVACNIEDTISDSPTWDKPVDLYAYPNPTNRVVILTTEESTDMGSLKVLNLLGQTADFNARKIADNRIELDLSGNPNGIYIVRLKSKERTLSTKISLISE